MRLLLVAFLAFSTLVHALPDDTTTELPPDYSIEPQLWDEPIEALATPRIKSPAPKDLLTKTLSFFEKNKDKIANKRFIGIADYSPNSKWARFYIIDLEKEKTTTLHVAHATGSDPDNNGTATIFSNVPESHKSSLGFYLTAESYSGNNGFSRRLDGLSSTNSNARARAIVLHSASYVVDSNTRPGRSWGCLVVSKAKRDWVMNTLSKGSLIYVGLSQ